jgi:hypothetical protein
VGAELIKADRRPDGMTNVTKLISALHDYGNAPKFSVNYGTQNVIVLRTCSDTSTSNQDTDTRLHFATGL